VAVQDNAANGAKRKFWFVPKICQINLLGQEGSLGAIAPRACLFLATCLSASLTMESVGGINETTAITYTYVNRIA